MCATTASGGVASLWLGAGRRRAFLPRFLYQQPHPALLPSMGTVLLLLFAWGFASVVFAVVAGRVIRERNRRG